MQSVVGLEVKREDVAWGTHTSTVTTITVDPRRFKLAVVSAADSGKALMHLDDMIRGAGALGGINGGFFEPNHEESGLVIEKGKTLHEITHHGGSGIFYIDVNGMIGILSRDDYHEQLWDYALQCGPRLVDHGMSLVQPVRQDVNIRSAVAIDSLKRVALIVADPISLFELGGFLSRRYESAMNLDGGPSSRLFLNDNGKITEMGSHSVTPNAIVILARK